jgi:HD-GYP domain-containing protein (c-di-GMP phosphodiesterase class II)
MAYLSAEELLAGSTLSYDLEVPEEVIHPGQLESEARPKLKIKLKPLSMNSVQRILKASRDDDGLMSALMVKESVMDPVLSYDDVMKLNSGLIRFILGEVQRISGLKAIEDELIQAVQEPMAKACFILAREFGWSPQQISDLTLGQVLMYIEMIRQNRSESLEAC